MIYASQASDVDQFLVVILLAINVFVDGCMRNCCSAVLIFL